MFVLLSCLVARLRGLLPATYLLQEAVLPRRRAQRETRLGWQVCLFLFSFRLLEKGFLLLHRFRFCCYFSALTCTECVTGVCVCMRRGPKGACAKLLLQTVCTTLSVFFKNACAGCCLLPFPGRHFFAAPGHTACCLLFPQHPTCLQLFPTRAQYTHTLSSAKLSLPPSLSPVAPS